MCALNSGERIPHKLCFGVSEQYTQKVLTESPVCRQAGIPRQLAARSFNKLKKSTFRNYHSVEQQYLRDDLSIDSKIYFRKYLGCRHKC